MKYLTGHLLCVSTLVETTEIPVLTLPLQVAFCLGLGCADDCCITGSQVGMGMVTLFCSVGIWPRYDPSDSGWVIGLRRAVFRVILGFDLVLGLNFDVKESSRHQNWA